MKIKIKRAITPYAGTSGWSGTDTSLDRALEADRSGKTLKTQQSVLLALYYAGRRGLTWKEVDDQLHYNHHGKTTGALSVLHKAEKISRLAERRNGSKIYVYPEFVDGRETERQGR